MKVDIEEKKLLLYFRTQLKIVVLRFIFLSFFLKWSTEIDIYFGAKMVDVDFKKINKDWCFENKVKVYDWRKS